MKKRRIKILERNDSRYNPGWLAVILILIGTISSILLRQESGRDWVNRKIIEIGLGDFGGYGGWITVVIAGSIFMLGVVLASHNKKKLQKLRDVEAVLDYDEDENIADRALYLRPFFTDSKIGLQNPFYSRWSGGVSSEPPGLGPEEFIGRVLEPYINVREVEGSDKTIGLGRLRISDSERWQSVVIRSIMEAPLIIVLPSLSQPKNNKEISGLSTMWELKQLVELNRLDSTIAIMPNSDWFHRKTIRKNWEEACSKGKEFGLVLPEYSKKGCIIIFEHKNKIWQPLKIFGQSGTSQKRLARGLVEAYMYQVERFS
jgi:hypothetical protein